MNNLENYSENTFESIKHTNAYDVEFWFARELASALEYVQWRNFEMVIVKAKDSCSSSGNSIEDHFADVSKMIEI